MYWKVRRSKWSTNGPGQGHNHTGMACSEDERNIWCVIKVQLFTSPVPPGPPHQIMKGSMSHEPIIHVTIIKLTVLSKLSLSYNTCYIKYLYLFKPLFLGWERLMLPLEIFVLKRERVRVFSCLHRAEAEAV